MKIQDICKVFTDGDWIESKDQSDTGIRLIQTGNIGEGSYLDKETRAKYISEDTFNSLKCTEIFPGDILVSRLPEPVGRACIVPERAERMITAVDCTICRVDESIITKEYLCYYMRSSTYYNRLLNNVTGTTRKRISRKNLGNVEITVPSLNEQKNIVSRLDLLVSIIDSRKQELTRLDDLIKARFVELFGDVKYGFNRWGGKSFGDITINLDSGRKPVKDADRKKMQGVYPYYGATGIVDYVNDYRQEGEFLLISEDGKALELRSKPIAFLASGKIWVNNHAHVQQCTNECNMIYLMYHINLMDISIWVTGIDQKKLNRANLDTIPIALPPIDIQDLFADFVKQVDKSKVAIQKSLDETQLLFDSLMQKYFG